MVNNAKVWFSLSVLFCTANSLISDQNEAWRWFYEIDKDIAELVITGSEISWNYATNITDYNQQKEIEFSEVIKEFKLKVAVNASLFDFENFENATLKKEFKKLADRSLAALPDAEFTEVIKLGSDLKSIYDKGKICTKDGKSLSLYPDLTNMMSTSRDADKLLWIWKNWRDATGKVMRQDYLRFVELLNKAATLNGYADTGETWRQGYHIDGYDFRADLERLYDELKPFYKELHTYVKNKLKAHYGADKFPSTGHIPAHLLGNMWAQTWGNIEGLVLPFKTSKPVNATPALQKLTVREMFNMSNEFYTSLGLEPVTPLFWNNSMIEKPTDGRDVVCHPTAWDFGDGKDFRIQMCTQRNNENFVTIHHEMGHVQYYSQYKSLPFAFKGGANPAFHEAVGDAIALSVSTPKHLKEVGLIDSLETNNESDINYMMSIALEKIVFLPFGKLMDDYRWAVFDGSISHKDMNTEWWKRRCAYQGVSPPVQRSENDFDPGSKFHIAANVPYVRYFVSFVLQFQFHKSLCAAAGHTGPLHTCDIYRSADAGKKLGDMLKLGSSQEWTLALEAITGSKNMSAEPLLEYFQPLFDWLKTYNAEQAHTDDDWTEECPTDLPQADTVEPGLCLEEPPADPDLETSAATNVRLPVQYIFSIVTFVTFVAFCN